MPLIVTETASKTALWCRISEILKEEGPTFTQKAFAKRLGYGRETLRLMLRGKREIYDFELRKIASTLKYLEALLINLKDNQRALELAQKHLEIAIGWPERCVALDNLGRAHYLMRQYEESHQLWQLAYTYAEKIRTTYHDISLL
jgi:tetratricopeptide (TPR) repeat protein